MGEIVNFQPVTTLCMNNFMGTGCQYQRKLREKEKVLKMQQKLPKEELK